MFRHQNPILFRFLLNSCKIIAEIYIEKKTKNVLFKKWIEIFVIQYSTSRYFYIKKKCILFSPLKYMSIHDGLEESLAKYKSCPMYFCATQSFYLILYCNSEYVAHACRYLLGEKKICSWLPSICFNLKLTKKIILKNFKNPNLAKNRIRNPAFISETVGSKSDIW